MTALSPLGPAALSYLSNCIYRPDAAQQVCLIPLCGIYWEDEMPSVSGLMGLTEEDRLQVFRLFSIRYKLWDGEKLSFEEQQFWDSARSQVPDHPIFQRTALSAADKRAHEEARQSCEEEFEAFFADADEVTLTDHGTGIQSFSAKSDLTKKGPAPALKQAWWKRLFSRKD